MERTLILLKPDAVQRGLVGQIIARFEAKGLQLAGMKLMQVTPELAAKHYAEHVGKPFYDGLVKFVTSGALVGIVIQGHGAVAVCRKLIGKTFGAEAEPGTIRGDFGVSRSFNLVHGSDSPASGDREVALFFPEGCLDYSLDSLQWVYDAEDAE